MGRSRIDKWFGRYRSALSHRDLRLLFVGLIVSQTGSWAYNVGLLAVVYERTHSFAWIGWAGAARFLPSLIASPYGGVIAERTERIRLMITADLLCMVWQIGLAVVALSGAPVGLVLVVAALTSVTNIVYNPSVSATIPAIVSEDDLVAANSLNSTIDNLVVILGPAVGALLLLAGSPSTTFFVNAGSFGLSAVVVSRISIRSRPIDVTEAGTVGPMKQMLVGFRTILRQRAARSLVSLCAVTSFIYGTDTVLFVAVSQHRLGLGSEGFGYLMAGLGIGGIFMALAMDRISEMDNLAPLILAGLALYSLPTASLIFLHNGTVAVAIQILRGAATLIVDVLAVTSLQRSVPSEELARVFGVFWAFVLVAISLGALLTPLFVNHLGLNDALFTMALAPFALGLLGYMSLLRVDATASVTAKALAPKVAILEKLGMFETANRMVLERLASVETDLTFEPSTVIVSEGDAADAMYVLEDGEVEVRAHAEPGTPDRVICTLTAPNYFGEIGVIEGIPRTATVAAITECRCARIEGSDLLEALTVAGPSASLTGATRTRRSVTQASRGASSAVPEASSRAPVIDLSEPGNTAPTAPAAQTVVLADEETAPLGSDLYDDLYD